MSRNTSVPEIFDVAHIFVRSPPFSPKMISHKTTFEEIFFNNDNVVAYAFTYAMVSAQFLRNVPILRYIKYN